MFNRSSILLYFGINFSTTLVDLSSQFVQILKSMSIMTIYTPIT